MSRSIRLAKRGQWAASDFPNVGMLLCQLHENLSRLLKISGVADTNWHGNHDSWIYGDEIHRNLICHRGVWHDNAPIVPGPKYGVPERYDFDYARFKTCWGGHLDTVSHLKGPVEQQRHSSNQIAERILCRQTKNDGYRLPVVLVYKEPQASQSLALKREATIKAMSRLEKESLIRQTG